MAESERDYRAEGQALAVSLDAANSSGSGRSDCSVAQRRSQIRCHHNTVSIRRAVLHETHRKAGRTGFEPNRPRLGLLQLALSGSHLPITRSEEFPHCLYWVAYWFLPRQTGLSFEENMSPTGVATWRKCIWWCHCRRSIGYSGKQSAGSPVGLDNWDAADVQILSNVLLGRPTSWN